MYLSIITGAPSATTLVLVNGATDTGYKARITGEFAAPKWEHRFTGARGTQGGRPAQGTPQNRTVSLPIIAGATTKDGLATKVADLLSAVDELRRYGGQLKTKFDNQTYFQYVTVLAAGVTEVPDYGIREVKNRAEFVLEFIAAPYLVGDSMDITDLFTTDSITAGDYVADSGLLADLTVTGGVLSATGNLSSTKRIVHTILGYTYGDHQAQIKVMPGTTIASFEAGVILKRTASNQYLRVRVSDSGASSRLRLDKVVAGVATNLYDSGAFGTRIQTGVAFWVRGRIEGNVVSVDYFTSAPTPTTSGTATSSYTLTGDEITNFGSAVKGYAGIHSIPQSTNAWLDEFYIRPYTYKSLTTPASQVLNGTIPGDTSALVDAEITTTGGSVGPAFCLLGWSATPGTGLAAAPFGIIEAESADSLTTWAVTADADYRGSSGLQYVTAGAATSSAAWYVDPSLLMADDYTSGEVNVEVWARVEIDDTVVSPYLTLSATASAGVNYGAARYSAEYGSTGKLLTVPSAQNFWFVRLGTVLMKVNRSSPLTWALVVAGSWAAGSTGVFGLDYLICVPSRGRALSPTGKTLNSDYPSFVPSPNETMRVIHSDLSGTISDPPANQFETHGLGGQLLEWPVPNVTSVVKLSIGVPDTPTTNDTGDNLSNTASIHYAVTPRWHLLRET